MVCFLFQNNEIEKFVWLRMKIINRKFAVGMYSECRLCIVHQRLIKINGKTILTNFVVHMQQQS
jgi:hypothetical protein